MKYTVGVKPEIFLDTKIVYSNDVITTEVRRNEKKLPVHWSSKVPKQWLWHRGVVVITTAQLHSTKPELRFCAGSNPARDVPEIRSGEDLWQWSRLEIRLNAFRWSTIPQKQFIIIIIRNAIISDLNRATRTASFPADEIPKIKQKFLNAEYPYRIFNSVINNFQEKSGVTDDYIIPPGLSDIPKKVVLVDITYCPKDETFHEKV